MKDQLTQIVVVIVLSVGLQSTCRADNLDLKTWQCLTNAPGGFHQIETDSKLICRLGKPGTCLPNDPQTLKIVRTLRGTIEFQPGPVGFIEFTGQKAGSKAMTIAYRIFSPRVSDDSDSHADLAHHAEITTFPDTFTLDPTKNFNTWKQFRCYPKP